MKKSRICLAFLLSVCILSVLFSASAKTVTYAVTDGNIYFDTATGTITDCDTTVTAAKIPTEIDGVAVKAIGQSAFWNCSALTSITLPEGVTSIGDSAFGNCSSLTTLTLPDSVETIGNHAFYYCSGLTEVVLSENLTSIGESAFYSAGALEKIEFPFSLRTIGKNAFYGTALTSVEISQMITIGEYAFQNCSKLTSVSVSCETIPKGAFSWCQALESVTFGKNVKYIGEHAFDYSVSLKRISLPIRLQTLGEQALAGSGLTEIVIPSSVQTIEYGTFTNCKSLTSATIGAKEIKHNAFYWCTALTDVTFTANVETIGDSAFSRTGLTEITLPSSVKNMGTTVFSYCQSLTKATIGSEIIGDSTFYNCTALNEVTLLDSVRVIDTTAFWKCAALETVTAENGLEVIADDAFMDCTALKTVDIPTTVKIIALEAFSGCTSLTTVNYEGTEAQWKDICIGEGNDPLCDAIGYPWSDPFYSAKTGPIPQFVFTDLNGEIVKNDYCSDIKVIIFFDTSDENARNCLNDLATGDIAGEYNVTIIAAGLGGATTDEIREFADTYALGGENITFCAGGDRYIWQFFYAAGDRTGYVMQPCYFIVDENDQVLTYNFGFISVFDIEDNLTFYTGDTSGGNMQPCGWFEPGTCPPFELEDLDGNTITNDTFGDDSMIIIAFDPESAESQELIQRLSNGDLTERYDVSIIALDVTSWSRGVCRRFADTYAAGGEDITFCVDSDGLYDSLFSASGHCNRDYLTLSHVFVVAPNDLIWYSSFRTTGTKTLEYALDEIADDGGEWGGVVADSLDRYENFIAADPEVFVWCERGIVAQNIYDWDTVTDEQMDYVRELTFEITEGCTTPEEEIWAVAEYLAKNICYDYDYYERKTENTNLNAYTVLTGEHTVCDGYAITFAVMMQMLENPCVRVGSPCHAWNMVHNGERWMLVDVTWMSGSTMINGVKTKSDNVGTTWYDFTIEQANSDGNHTISNFTYSVCNGVLESFPYLSRATSFVIPDGVTSIGHYAFSQSLCLESVAIPNSVTSIGDCAFYLCSNLESVVMPERMDSIGYDAFAYCDKLESITIPEGITTIPYGMLMGCTGLSKVVIPEGVTTIEGDAFQNCTSLTEITLPKSVQTLQWEVFSGCSSLERIVIPEGVTRLETNLFWGCTSLTEVMIPASVTFIDDYVFAECTALTTIYYGGTREQWEQIEIDFWGNGCLLNAKIICAGETSLDAPTVKATNIASTGKIKLTWNEVDGAEKYEVWRATSKNGTYTKLTTTTKTSITNTSAKAGTTYYYKVRAIAGDVQGEFSTIVSRTCDLARPVVKTTNIASTGKIKISWNKVEGAVKYEVYRATSKNGKYTKLTTTTKTSVTNSKTEAGVTYYYRVKAIAKSSAANSAASTAVGRTCDLARPTVTVKLNSKGKPVISWNKISGAVKYEVYRATSENGKYTKLTTTTKTSITNSKTEAGVTYYYRVRAIAKSSAANSAYSAVCYVKAK